MFIQNSLNVIVFKLQVIFTSQTLRVTRYFSPMVSGWVAGGWWENVCPGYISESVRCRKFILGKDIGYEV